MNTIFRLTTLCLITAALYCVGCSMGDTIKFENIQKLQLGSTTRTQAEELIGKPSMRSQETTEDGIIESFFITIQNSTSRKPEISGLLCNTVKTCS